MDESYVKRYPEIEREHFWWRIRREIVVDRVHSLTRDIERPVVLDVGCGSGVMMEALAETCNVYGIEVDPEALVSTSAMLGRISVGDILTVDLGAGFFDVALMLDVLEHVEEPVEALKRVRHALRTGGHLIITVPAYRWLWSSHDVLNHHQDRYTRPRLVAALEEAGFRVTRTEQLFAGLLFPKALVALLERVFGRGVQTAAVLPGPLNRMAMAWFRREHALGAKLREGFPFGTSILCQAVPEP